MTRSGIPGGLGAGSTGCLTGGTGSGTASADLLDAHAAAAGTLSRLLLAPPDESVLAALRDTDLITQWPLAVDVGAGTGTSGGGDQARDDEALRAGLDLLAAGSQTPLRDIEIDHRVLFVGPESMRACPYESVYTSVDHLTFEAQTLQVRRWYAAYGLQAPRVHREPDDHLGLELAFVSHLCLAALDAGASEAALDPIARFLRDHVLTFLPQVAGHIVTGAATDFYRGVGHLLGHAGTRLERDLAS